MAENFSEMIIKESNTNKEEMIIAIAYSGILFIPSFYLWHYLPFILFFILLVLFKYKTIEIEIISDWITIKWKLFNITYRKRKKKFDSYKIEEDMISLWQNGIQEMQFDIGLAVEETEITSMTIWIGNKFYTVGNKKNALIIFNQIKKHYANDFCFPHLGSCLHEPAKKK